MYSKQKGDIEEPLISTMSDLLEQFTQMEEEYTFILNDFNTIADYESALRQNYVEIEQSLRTGQNMKGQSKQKYKFTSIAKLKMKEEIDIKLKRMSAYYQELISKIKLYNQDENGQFDQINEKLMDIKNEFDLFNDKLDKQLAFISTDLRKTTNMQKIGGKKSIYLTPNQLDTSTSGEDKDRFKVMDLMKKQNQVDNIMDDFGQDL